MRKVAHLLAYDEHSLAEHAPLVLQLDDGVHVGRGEFARRAVAVHDARRLLEQVVGRALEQHDVVALTCGGGRRALLFEEAVRRAAYLHHPLVLAIERNLAEHSVVLFPLVHATVFGGELEKRYVGRVAVRLALLHVHLDVGGRGVQLLVDHEHGLVVVELGVVAQAARGDELEPCATRCRRLRVQLDNGELVEAGRRARHKHLVLRERARLVRGDHIHHAIFVSGAKRIIYTFNIFTLKKGKLGIFKKKLFIRGSKLNMFT